MNFGKNVSKPFDRFNLSGKTALITGAAGLLGVEHASALLESGAMVVLTDIREAGLASAPRSFFRKTDSGQTLTRLV